jgi:hypothetical protein
VKCCEQVRASECHCALCHRTFTGLTLFDAHQDVDYGRDPVIICRDPASQGLAQSDRGTWGTPEGLKARERSATALARARSAQAPQPPAVT